MSRTKEIERYLLENPRYLYKEIAKRCGVSVSSVGRCARILDRKNGTRVGLAPKKGSDDDQSTARHKRSDER